ncbi:ATP-binding cassette domain-containing protein [Nocardioides bizhenqiangii]|uniref:ATP-binding cassette domain-containing protein n=1 Tax=Nocardioides bizhenqiangii TaxID=3095076 RepID=A0ABZ0ZR98_9ACTN|nr:MULTISPECIES: ATP-binding cassette domain-containing protein [unclassified Nocardioides]MDZ5619596.1 ATP-binding cassette domain-containing protein [Nocardioides sp. HM23]WQQ26389.1 ATP-binding cassette domain-containing protein [Nocardioides sp. HM61]
MSVVVSGLRCSYRSGDRPAVSIDSLELTAGPVGLVGVNGAGKSTLLRTLAGARRPQHGTVVIDGKELYGRHGRTAVQGVGYMPQEIQFPGELSVTQVLRYLCWLRGIRSRAATTRCAQVIDAVGLIGQADQRTRQLSGGMRRRLALAAALVSEPRVLLLDEPTTGLDPEQRAGVRRIVAGFGEECLTVMSSHVMEDVASVTATIVVLHEGSVHYQGVTDAFVAERGGPERSPELAFLSTIARSKS